MVNKEEFRKKDNKDFRTNFQPLRFPQDHHGGNIQGS